MYTCIIHDDVGDKNLEKCRQKEIVGLPHKGLKTDLAWWFGSQLDSVIALLQTTRMVAGQRRLVVVVVANKAKDKCRRVTITPPFSKADTVESEASADKTFCAGTILLLLHHLHNERLLMTQGRMVTRMLKRDLERVFCEGGGCSKSTYSCLLEHVSSHTWLLYCQPVMMIVSMMSDVTNLLITYNDWGD